MFGRFFHSFSATLHTYTCVHICFMLRTYVGVGVVVGAIDIGEAFFFFSSVKFFHCLPFVVNAYVTVYLRFI